MVLVAVWIVGVIMFMVVAVRMVVSLEVVMISLVMMVLEFVLHVFGSVRSTYKTCYVMVILDQT